MNDTETNGIISIEEIADILNIPAHVIMRDIIRARRKIKEEIKRLNMNEYDLYLD